MKKEAYSGLWFLEHQFCPYTTDKILHEIHYPRYYQMNKGLNNIFYFYYPKSKTYSNEAQQWLWKLAYFYLLISAAVVINIYLKTIQLNWCKYQWIILSPDTGNKNKKTILDISQETPISRCYDTKRFNTKLGMITSRKIMMKLKDHFMEAIVVLALSFKEKIK